MKKMKILLLKCLLRTLMPKDVFVGIYKGAYTQKYDVVFGRLDSRGVLQGICEEEVF